MRKIDEIVLHCSATKEGQDFSAEDIRQWHLNRGWRDIGYHYVIRLDGSLEIGRDLSTKGAHVKGNNSTTIGICYIGGLDKSGKPKDTMTYDQIETFRDLVMALRIVFNAHLKLSGHNEYSSKACPSFSVTDKFEDLL